MNMSNEAALATNERMEAPASAPDRAGCVKQSFLKLPVPIDATRLLDEFGRIPTDAWGVSHWDVHCSIDVLLLRGGTKGKAEDFTTAEVTSNPILEQLPYISSLLAPEGPFGGAVYAFIFRTKPNGITRVHSDNDEAWWRTARIHLPIVTNDGAFLLAEGRAKHLEVGEAWTFDNQSRHSVVNGNATRVHMIIDVAPNPKLAQLLENATFDPGDLDPERWALTGGIHAHNRIAPLVAAVGEPLSISEKDALGLNPDGFATRIAGIRKRADLKVALKAVLSRSPLKSRDIVVAVNGVETSALSRTALDHIALQHQPGETVTLDVLRNGDRLALKMHLKPEHYLSPRMLRRFMTNAGNGKSGY
jgi:hypothetical protein